MSTGIATTSNCGFVDVKSSNGRFTSPNYPGQYNKNQKCTWTLTSTPPSSRISLSFQTFDVQHYCDHVQVYDGNSSSSPLLGEFYGTTLPPTIISSSNQLHITFTSDDHDTKTGFSASYKGSSFLLTIAHISLAKLVK